MTEVFTAISDVIWDSKYRLKKFDGTPIDLTPSHTYMRVADALAAVEPASTDAEPAGVHRARRRQEFFNVMANGYFSPAGRILAGAGSGRNVTLSNCFTMGTIPDSMDGIFSHLKEAALTMQQGGGIGYDFSTIRPKGAEVKGVAADASGPLTFMDVWDAMCRTVMSAGSRRGAMMATMRCDHPDIEAFIDAKKDPAKLRMFNLSVLITDAFMEAVRNDQPWRLHFENRRGETISEKTINARDLWNKIMRNTYDFAEPGVIFIDRVNQDHNLGYLETVATTNPCGEKPMGPYASCLLGSVCLPKLITDAFGLNARINKTLLREVVATAIRMMDNVIEAGTFPLPEQAKKARDDRQLGLGVTGLADALIMCGLVYGSPEAVAWTDDIMREIAIAAYDTSADLAIERGSFPSLNVAEFLKPGRFAGRMLPNWLQEKIMRKGIRNGLLLSIAPTGTISMFAGNVSSGIEPVFAFEYERKILQPDGSHDIQTVYDYAMNQYKDFCANMIGDVPPGPAFVTAQTLAPIAHVRMQAAAQKWVDSSISKTVNCPEDISFEDFQAIYLRAFEMGCKGCTTYRPNPVTGSILSVKAEEPQADLVLEAITPEELEIAKNEANVFLSNDPDEVKRRLLKATLVSLGIPRVGSATTKDQFLALMEIFKPSLTSTPRDEVRPELKTLAVVIMTEGGETIWAGDAADLTEEDWPEGDGISITLVLPDTEGQVYNFESRVEPYIDPEDPRPGSESWADTAARVTQPHDEGPQARPNELPAAVYKLKWPGSDHAIYVTLADIIDPDTQQRRPFELFINSKNMEHFAWTVALTRMVSAIFRRPHDSSFVVEELKAVFDPKGGAWMEGVYVPSILAAIGGIIENHMRAIGYYPDDGLKIKLTAARRAALGLTRPVMRDEDGHEVEVSNTTDGRVREPYVPVKEESFMEAMPFRPNYTKADPFKLDETQKFIKGLQERSIAVPKAMTAPYGAPPPAAASVPLMGAAPTGPMCQKCSSFNVKNESGCFTCLDCGHSKCG